jgi:signal transduction histidine kinase
VRKNGEVERAAGSMRTIVTVVPLLAFVLGIAGSVRLTRRMLQPLDALADAARRLGEQDFDARARIQGRDEIARLAAEFDGMADRLQRYQRSTLGELLQAQLAAQSAIDSLPDPVLVFDLDGALLAANEAATRTLGARAGEPSADPLRGADPAVRALVAKVREHVLFGRGPYVPRGFEEAVRVMATEGEHFLLARGAPVYDREAAVTGATVVLQDVTRLRRFDQLKTDLVATVAHELRTPLTSLHMAIHLCLEGAAGPLSEKQIDLLDAARADCVRLQAMVNDLLDVSRFEGGVVPIETRPVAPGELLLAAEESHRASAELKGVGLEHELVEDLPPVAADPERLPLVLDNLLENAIRYTASGGRVTLRARPDVGSIRFEVEDTGKGIPLDLRAQIFEKFARGRDEEPGGAGLGLFLAREIVRGHGGEIGVDEAPGGGSLFWFTLPRAEPVETGS